MLWATTFVLLGYAAGSQYDRVAHNASLLGLGLLVVIAAVVIFRAVHNRRSTAPQP